MGKRHDFIVRPGSRPRLKNYDTAFTGGFADESAAREKIEANCDDLARLQDKLMAGETHALLVIFQAVDGSGKDGTIKHVASGLDPQGCTAVNFKKPSEAENRHDYLWRFHQQVPERGRITFFNRSYYEEVISPRVFHERLDEQKLPPASRGKDIWKRRMQEINNFEQYLVDNGVIILKFFLHLSKEKQAERLLERTEESAKKWKFSSADLENRDQWDEHVRAHEEMLARTSTRAAPWHIIPADHRWFSAIAVAELMAQKLHSLKPRYPAIKGEEKSEMGKARKQLKRELTGFDSGTNSK
ncbi:MAG TPA: PPK2 family polyphosphate kinase [Pyrinomonadaceae bacterium]|jgi:PPK2 family polyphosphate:nucleotide phosphotransferase|nr:PPK2 family polyphosphate kinase [Pyrinomonadaceae bacterium]